MRRMLCALLLLTVLLGVPGAAVAAQDATPAVSPFAELGLPSIDLTATTTGYEGAPDQLEAGRYAVNLTASDDVDFGAALEFIQPTMVSAAEFVDMVTQMRSETGPEIAADASPFPEEIATPSEIPGATPAAGGDEMDAIPEEYTTATFAGGVAALAGQTSSVVLDLPPGEWVMWPGDPMAQQGALALEVTGEMPADLPEPDANATITMGEMYIEVSEGELTTGSNVVRVDNIGAQPHFIVWFQGPDGMTEEQIATVLQEEMDAMMAGTEPEFSALDPNEDLIEVTFTGTQSTGTSIWVTVDNVEAGSHGLVCFFPDTGDGVPHAYHGMYTVVEIAD